MNCSTTRLPSLEFTRETFFIVSVYLLVFLVALLGNMSVFVLLLRNQMSKRRRIHSLLLHNTIAHLLVTLVYIPKEVIHTITGMWHGGDTLCRLCKFFDVFGVSLSANILMCLSLDRFYSILFPLYSINAKKHVLRMIAAAWTTAFLSSLPQVYIFRTAVHPCFPWYTQCVSSDLIGLISPQVTFWFSVLNILEVYFVPLVVIVVSYGSIWVKLGSKLLKSKTDGTQVGQDQALLRRAGGQDNFERAKNRTLQMTVVVVLSYVLCWSPYTMAMFIHFLQASAHHRPISPLLSKLLYAFAVFNSAASPYLCVYSYFSFQQIRVELRRFFCCQPASTTNARTSSLAERRRAIRQRPADSLTNNSLSAFGPNTTTSLNFSRRISTATDSRTARVRRLGTSSQAYSLDETSGSHSCRPSQLRIMSTITDVSPSPLESDPKVCPSRKASSTGTAQSSPALSVHRDQH